MLRHVFLRVGGLLLALLISACANTPLQKTASSNYWQGKLAVKVFGKPVQAFSANFELQGQAEQGELVLTTPLGTTVARMQWTAQSATLYAQGTVRQFDSLAELAWHVTGAELPVASLFAWLQGIPEAAPGWEADLSEAAQGRISGRHTEAVAAEFRILVEQ